MGRKFWAVSRFGKYILVGWSWRTRPAQQFIARTSALKSITFSPRLFQPSSPTFDISRCDCIVFVSLILSRDRLHPRTLAPRDTCFTTVVFSVYSNFEHPKSEYSVLALLIFNLFFSKTYLRSSYRNPCTLVNQYLVVVTVIIIFVVISLIILFRTRI